eukprot:10291612-Alexandrium_andersonii.AAC.1
MFTLRAHCDKANVTIWIDWARSRCDCSLVQRGRHARSLVHPNAKQNNLRCFGVAIGRESML